MTARATRSMALLAAVLAAASCGDQGPTTPVGAGQIAAFAKSSPAPDQVVRILERTAPLHHDLTTSGVIGPAGGRLEIPLVGLTVEFAAGAVRRPIHIEITAIRGSGVAYEFQPHGLIFGAPVRVVQNLKHTTAEHDRALGSTLQGSYFDTELAQAFVDSTDQFARVKERRPARFHSITGVLEFSIEHFSGYMISVGLAGTSAEIRAD